MDCRKTARTGDLLHVLLDLACRNHQAYRLYKELTEGQDTPEQKSAMDRYQSALLMPEWLVREAAKGYDLSKLSSLYDFAQEAQVTISNLTTRLRRLGLIHKVGTGNAELRWADAVDEALCVGWIDGVRRRIDDDRYVIRFTPRKPRSTWSAVNIRRAGELIAAGRMRPAGLAAFGETRPIHIVSRKASASPSTGSTKKHALEQAELMARAFDR